MQAKQQTTTTTTTDVYAEYERHEAMRAATSYVVMLHNDEYSLFGSRVVWEGQGYWEAQRWAQSAAKSLVCTNPHSYVDRSDDSMTFSAYREDFSTTGTRFGASYILVGHVTVEEVRQPEPQETPKSAKTTKKRTTKRSGASRETQRVARERVVQQSLRREGTARYNELVEVFTCASTSTPGARYTITHDTVTGAVVCNCPAGEHQHGCLHAQAVTRYLRNRADAINKAADEAVRAHEAMEQHAKDTALLRRETFSFWR